MLANSFPPVADARSRVLVLGSMPGKASLAADQYYAHPHNAFWRIVADLFGAPRDLAYPRRIALLRKRGVALWDVLESCERQSSLDSDIRDDTITVNDFATFFAEHPRIDVVYFNGAKAEQVFRRRVLRTLEQPELRLVRLPSTSPAHAALGYDDKLRAWSELKGLRKK